MWPPHYGRPLAHRHGTHRSTDGLSTLKAVKASDLERLAGDEKARELVTLDPSMARLARDAARVFSAAVDAGVVKSVANTMLGFKTTQLINFSAAREAANMLDSISSSHTARLTSERLAEALKDVNAPNAKRISEAFESVQVASLVRPRLAEALRSLDLQPTFRRQIAEALKDLPTVAAADVAPMAGQAVKDAVRLAETSTAPDLVDEPLHDLDELSPAARRELEKDIVDAIAALGTVVAILARNGRIELASAMLAFVAILISIYWRITGKLTRLSASDRL